MSTLPNPAELAALTGRGWAASPRITEAVAQTRLDEAWRALHFEDGLYDLDARLADGSLDPALVVDVVANAALRVLSNPDAVKSESYSLDDYSESRDRGDTSSDLYFTAAELRRLRANGEPSGYPQQWSGSIPYVR